MIPRRVRGATPGPPWPALKRISPQTEEATRPNLQVQGHPRHGVTTAEVGPAGLNEPGQLLADERLNPGTRPNGPGLAENAPCAASVGRTWFIP